MRVIDSGRCLQIIYLFFSKKYTRDRIQNSILSFQSFLEKSRFPCPSRFDDETSLVKAITQKI